MAIGGLNTGWDNTTPAAGDDSGLGDDHFRSIKTSLQEILDSEHDFTTTGGTKTGMHRHGSALPYVGVQSNVSSADTLGRFYFASDESRLYVLGDASSRGTIYIGGVNSVEHKGSGTGFSTGDDTGARNVIWVTQSGHTQLVSGGITVVFTNTGGVAYNGIPVVTASIWTSGIDPTLGAVTGWFGAITKTGFVYAGRQTAQVGGAPTASKGTVVWQSIGSVTI